MRKQITYFDPRVIERNPVGEMMTIIANNEEEMEAIETSIRNPERGITDISEWEDVPPTVDELQAELAETDYKIIKSSEYQLAGLEMPYDIAALHVAREALRERIRDAGE